MRFIIKKTLKHEVYSMDTALLLKALGDSTRFMIFQQILIRKHCVRLLSKKTWPFLNLRFSAHESTSMMQDWFTESGLGIIFTIFQAKTLWIF